jgi:hypothetical protein
MKHDRIIADSAGRTASQFSVSKSQLESVQAYIQDQKAHHRHFNYQPE